MGALDGSETALRYPLYIPEISGSYRVPPIPRCGMVQAIREKDFVLIKPGESFDPEMKIDTFGFHRIWAFSSFRPDIPGEYRLKLKYSTDSDEPRKWLGHGMIQNLDKVLKLIEMVPKLTIESNVLIINLK